MEYNTILGSNQPPKFKPNPYENELERKQAAEQMANEADFMKNLFKKLSNSKENLAFDAIKSIADLIKARFIND